MYSGYVPIRRGLLDHIRSGDLTHEEALAYVITILEADCETGLWRGSAKALGPYNYSHRAARHILEQLGKKGYIKRFTKKGRRGNYPVLVNKYGVTRGRWAGRKLNADKTLNWKEPVYECQENGQQNGQLTAPSQEGEGRKRKRKEGTKASPSPLTFQGIVLRIRENQQRSFAAAYPSLNLQQEYHKMDAWLVTHPERPRKNHARFALNWLKGSETDRKDRERQEAGQREEREMVKL